MFAVGIVDLTIAVSFDPTRFVSRHASSDLAGLAMRRTRSGSTGQQEFPDIEVFELGWWLHSSNNRRRFMWRVVAYKGVLSTVAARLVESTDPLLNRRRYAGDVLRRFIFYVVYYFQSFHLHSSSRVVQYHEQGSFA